MSLKVSWFPELLPEQKIIEEKIINIIKKNYQKSGFTPIETPAVERNSVLTAKWGGEVSKQIFWLYGLAQGCSNDTKDYSLHFDLTVPFARYAVDYKNNLVFPFKRSQIQKVWRWERAQRWRFREFYQADIDTIWDEWRNLSDETKNLFYDAETIFVLANTLEDIFKNLWLENKVTINVNHKKIISWYIGWYLNLKDKLSQITIVIDKKDKISKEDFITELEKLELTKEQIEKIFDFINTENFLDLKNLDKELDAWISDLEQILSYLESFGFKDKVKVNLGIMRGLDYYTWIVFETFIEWERKLGSIASWWRYENLSSFIDPKTNFSGVGGSIGISRLEAFLFEKLNLLQKTTSEYMIVNFPQTQKEAIKLYKNLLENDVQVEFYPSTDKLGKQFKYADKKWIKFVIILWEEELEKWVFQVKNMETWEIKEYKIKIENGELTIDNDMIMIA